MKTLRELCAENKLPFKVRNDQWPNDVWFEIIGINSAWAVGLYNDNEGGTYKLDTSIFTLYTEQQPKNYKGAR